MNAFCRCIWHMTLRPAGKGLRSIRIFLIAFFFGGGLHGTINSAEIDDGALTHEQAQYRRDKYLWGKDV